MPKQLRIKARKLLILTLAISMAIPPQALMATGTSNPRPRERSYCNKRCYEGGGDLDSAAAMEESQAPTPSPASAPSLFLSNGEVEGNISDITLSGVGVNFSLKRSYNSALSGDSTFGNKWLSNISDLYLSQDGNDIHLLVNAISSRTFTSSTGTPPFTAPEDSTYELDHDSTNKEYVLTDRNKNMKCTFHDFTISPTAKRGKLKEKTTLEYAALGKSGTEYTYDSGGGLTQVTTTEGQDYSVDLTYSGSQISAVEVKDGLDTIKKVEYLYYDDVTSPSTDLGSSGDLVQVKTMERATSDTGTTLSIETYTQYRYDGSSRVEYVFEHEDVQRIIEQESGITAPEDILTKANNFGVNPISTLSSQRFEFYTSDESTSNINTPFNATENLESTYGAANTNETGLIKKQILGNGCTSCGSTTGAQTSYFYMDISQGATLDRNEVVRVVVEDVADSNGVAQFRKIRCLNNHGTLLRSAYIENPTGSAAYWCKSVKLKASGPHILEEEDRAISAHDVSSASDLRNFIDPYDSESDSWTNDENTLKTAEGAITVYTYNGDNLRTDTKIKKGKNGTLYYLSAIDIGEGDSDGVGSDDKYVLAKYRYPTKTTVRTAGIKTSYSYEFWDADDKLIKKKTTTLPIISTSQNGSGIATTTEEFFDTLGRTRWTKDGEGYISYTSYHPTNDNPALVVADIDPSAAGTEVESGSAGNWDSWTVGSANTNKPTRDVSLPTAIHHTSKTFYTDDGEQHYTIDATGTVNYMVTLEDQEVNFPNWDSTAAKSQMPISVTKYNNEGRVEETYAVRADYTAISTSSGHPTGFSTAPTQSDYVGWTRNYYDSSNGLLTHTDKYHKIPSSGSGTLSTNFYRTVYKYNSMGRVEYVINVASGSAASDRVEQVTQYVYDKRGRVIEVKSGVSGDSASNSHNMTDDYDTFPTLYTVSKKEYDNGGVGDGLVTKTKMYHGTGANDYRGVNFYYTYRGHNRGVESFYMNGSTETGYGPYKVHDLTWDGRQRNIVTYSSAPNWTSLQSGGEGYNAYAFANTTDRLEFSRTTYDDLGRAYDIRKYKIDPSTGLGSDFLSTRYYYNRNNQRVASAGSYTNYKEFAYDGLGRPYQTRSVLSLEGTKYSSGQFQYRSPVPHPSFSAMTGGDDLVLTLNHKVYENGLNIGGHVLATNHDDVAGAGRGIDLTNNDDYIRFTAYKWYDDANRVIATGNYGSGDTASGPGQILYSAVPARPTTAPATSESVLVTSIAYHSRTGRPESGTQSDGTVTKTIFDDLQRPIYQIQNYDNFDESTEANTGDSTDKSKDRVIKNVYPTSANISQKIALDANGDGNLSDNQTTTTLYEDSVNASWATNIIYPDSSDTTSTGSDQIKVEYHLDGLVKKRTDQKGTVVELDYTNKRQIELTKVTTLGTGVDGHVRSIKNTFNDLGQTTKITSYSNSDGTGTVRNEVQIEHTGYKAVSNSYQSHEGAVVTATTPKVAYSYDETKSGVVFSRDHRLDTVTYPSGRSVFYDFDSSSANTGFHNQVSAVQKIRETDASGTELANYEYNGAKLAVSMDLTEPDVKLDYFQGTSGTYAGLDRFGRTKDQYWAGYNSSSDVDRFGYAYDSAGRQNYRDISSSIYATNDKDQVFTYDGLGRLTAFDEGTLSGTSISGTPKLEQDWTRDSLDNWTNYETKSNGATDLNQTRTTNNFNETTNITETVGTAWVTPAHDANGNMTTVPQPGNLANSFTATYDAWNRLVKLSEGATTIAEYEYDGLNRRIVKSVYGGGTLNHKQHFYYNINWQLLEVRKEVSGSEDADPLEQYVWHPHYIDAPLLRDYDADTDGTSVRHYYTFDKGYNVTAALDDSGTVLERYHYTPYGELKVLDADFSNDSDGLSDIENRVTFTGRRYDEESGLYYFRNRLHHAQLGRFVTRDPLKFKDGMNLLNAYFAPFKTDPLGLSAAPGNTGSPLGNKISIIFLQRAGNPNPFIGGILNEVSDYFSGNIWYLADGANEFAAYFDNLPRSKPLKNKYAAIAKKFYDGRICIVEGMTHVLHGSGRRVNNQNWNWKSSETFDAGWWLHGAKSLRVSFRFNAKCTTASHDARERPKRFLRMEEIYGIWTWRDEVDARGFSQAIRAQWDSDWDQFFGSLPNIGIEGLWDLMEFSNRAEFNVEIRSTHRPSYSIDITGVRCSHCVLD